MSGSSAWFRGSVVAYANDAKERLLGVSGELIRAHGAVSGPVAKAMAEGVRRALDADYAVATTGVAGPGGGTPDKPVGFVWWALAHPGGTEAWSRRFAGDRELVRQWAAQYSLDGLRRRLEGTGGE
jgi:nicotinamide-nucleotide amidase